MDDATFSSLERYAIFCTSSSLGPYGTFCTLLRCNSSLLGTYMYLDTFLHHQDTFCSLQFYRKNVFMRSELSPSMGHTCIFRLNVFVRSWNYMFDILMKYTGTIRDIVLFEDDIFRLHLS